MSDWRDRLLERPRIAIDMDHVMADTGGALADWVEEKFGITFDAPQSFGTLRRRLSGEPRQALLDHVTEGKLFRTLPIMEGCVEVVRHLNDRFAVLIVTAAMEYPNGIPAKIDWLDTHFPFLDRLQYVFCGPKQLLNVDYLIDDSPKHFPGLKAKPLLYTAPHNVDETRYQRVDNWDDVATVFAKA